MMLSGKRIILGVTGGIAAYKAAFLLRAFQKEGAEVRVTMTPSAKRFVGVETFASLSRHDVAVDIFPEAESHSEAWTRHIEWGEWADLFVIAPCTANTLGKIANGLSDNMLTSTVMASRCPILICPTMDGEMFNAPATGNNLETVASYGYHILEPEAGYLASGLEGKGRLPEADRILKEASSILSKKKAKGPLTGKKVLVTAGPTREHIDPVRFISNPSTGKMGVAMAEAARDMGAEVTLIHGPVRIALPAGMETISIESASDLFEAVKNHKNSDAIIMAAAVSDFSPASYHDKKIKKDSGDSASEIKLKPTKDILAWLGKNRQEEQVLIGFAMETDQLLHNAAQKLKNKKADWIIANSLNDKNSGFGTDTNTIHILGHESRKQLSGPKKDIAKEALKHIFGD